MRNSKRIKNTLRMKATITIDGKQYPCAHTMGAMIRFKEETGREVTGIQPDAVSDLAVYLWCCVVSACRREGVEFKYQLMDFADRIALEDLSRWAAAISAENGSDGADQAKDTGGQEKKTAG